MTQLLWRFLVTVMLLAPLGPGGAVAAPTAAAVAGPSTATGVVTPTERLRELLTRLDRANQAVLKQHEASAQRSRYTILLKEAVRGKRISAATWQKVLQETNHREKEAVERLARRFRADVYRNFRSRRAVFTQHRAAWSRIYAAWEAADKPFMQQGELIEWLNSAIAASTPGALEQMPNDPTFTPMAAPSVPVQITERPSPAPIAQKPVDRPAKRATIANIQPARDLQEMLFRSFATGIDVPPEPPSYVAPDPSLSDHLAKIDSVPSDGVLGNVLPRETALLATVDSWRTFPASGPVLDASPIDRMVRPTRRSARGLPLVAAFPVRSVVPEPASIAAIDPASPVATTAAIAVRQPGGTSLSAEPQPVVASNLPPDRFPLPALSLSDDPREAHLPRRLEGSINTSASVSGPSDVGEVSPMLIMADPFAEPSLAVLSSQSPTVPPTASMALRDSPSVMPQMSQPTSVPLGPMPAGTSQAMRSGVPEEASRGMVNLDELSARIAGSNLATLALEADLADEGRRRNARELAQIIKRLDRVLTRQKDLGMLRELLPQGQRDRTSRLTSPGSLIPQAAVRIHEARTHTSSPDFRGNESHRLAELRLLDELSRQLVRIASDAPQP